MRKLCLAGVLLALSVGWTHAAFVPTGEPVKDGVRATVDLPVSQHMRNVGGSDGAGLCVFTSLQHAARWHGLSDLEGFRQWMQRKPGGGWPQKVDQCLAAFCREKGIQVPDYVQHTGGDDSFLELALHTDRIVCVTYAGRDDFYGGRIAHMVNLAHLDGERAAIIDNNRPGVWVWMTRTEFLQRWRDMQGGWAIAFLAPPPPPAPEKSQAFGAGCVCGDSCKCAAGKCPGSCPVAFGQCPNGQCPLPKGPRPLIPLAPYTVPVAPPTPLTAPEPIGSPPSDRHEWGEIPGHGYGWRFKAAPAAGGIETLTGVVSDKIHTHPTYSINGSEVSEADAKAALYDDSDRWHLTAVGDPAFLAKFKGDVAKLDIATRGKLLVQAYSPDAWPVTQYKLPPGVNLRKPSPGRVAADVGNVMPPDYTAAKLAELLSAPGGPVTPAPAPKIDPPAPTPAPGPAPAPAPTPTPAPDGGKLLGWLVAIGLGLFLLFQRKKV